MAWIVIMLMTMAQVFFFWPITAGIADRLWARKALFWYAIFFAIGALLWLLSHNISGERVTISTIAMTICFAAGYGCKFVDVYTLRMAPQGNSGIAFWWFVTFAGLGRFLGTLIQPYLVGESYPRGPIIMLAAMCIFVICLLFVPNDIAPHDKKEIIWKNRLHRHIFAGIQSIFISYKRAFIHWPLFVRRCHYFPLIPLSIALREWVFFWSLWFIVPLYMSQHPEYSSYWLEIGIYEIISVFIAVICWYIADKLDSKYNIFGGRLWTIIWVWILYFYPHIDILILVGVAISLSNNLLYASGQHILGQYDRDHADDAAYGQTRNIITNLGFMFMPVVWWLTNMDFSNLLKVFASTMGTFTMFGIIIAFYLLVYGKHRRIIH